MSLTVVHLTAELWPYARTGGLGQVAADLPVHQARCGATTEAKAPDARTRKTPVNKTLFNTLESP